MTLLIPINVKLKFDLQYSKIAYNKVLGTSRLGSLIHILLYLYNKFTIISIAISVFVSIYVFYCMSYC